MEQPMLGIGELAARSGRSIHALRYYENLGLLPFVQRDAGGRRRYDEQHVQWLLFLERLQQTGMSLAQMQEYAALVSRGKQTLGERIALLESHLLELDQRMRELQYSRELLLSKLDFYRSWLDSGKRPASWWVNAAPSAQGGPASAGKAGKRRHG
jgi:DNA-binding transcriptional MerR regulator